MKSLSENAQRILRVVAGRVVPDLDGLDEDGQQRFFAIVDRALMDRPPAVRRQFEMFLKAVQWMPVVRYGKPFDRLAADRRDRVLRYLEGCPLAILRSGCWGLKTIVFMGYYGQPETHPSVGYQPSFDSTARLGNA